MSRTPKRKASQDRYENSPVGRYRQLRHRARAACIPITLTAADLGLLLTASGGKCHYCRAGLSPSGSGVDRLDPAKGYEMSNVVMACGTCNRAKGSLSVAEFRAWVGRVWRALNRKGF